MNPRDLINAHKYLKAGCSEDESMMFAVMLRAMKRGNGHEMKHRRFCLNIRKQFFAVLQSTGIGCGISQPGDFLEQPALSVSD